MKTSRQIYDRHQRMFRMFMRLTAARAKRCCPSSDGSEMLCHNWGNPAFREELAPGATAAHAVWVAAWQRWRRIDDAYKLAYDLALHHQHEHETGRYLWCQHCKVARQQRRRAA